MNNLCVYHTTFKNIIFFFVNENINYRKCIEITYIGNASYFLAYKNHK